MACYYYKIHYLMNINKVYKLILFSLKKYVSFLLLYIKYRYKLEKKKN